MAAGPGVGRSMKFFCATRTKDASDLECADMSALWVVVPQSRDRGGGRLESGRLRRDMSRHPKAVSCHRSPKRKHSAVAKVKIANDG